MIKQKTSPIALFSNIFDNGRRTDTQCLAVLLAARGRKRSLENPLTGRSSGRRFDLDKPRA
jgi:hypothetical protein